MSGQKRKARVAALHKENIMLSSEHLFLEKGFEFTTIQEISKLSGYSRRTIYAYFASKEDILYHITLQGLAILQKNILDAAEARASFLEKYDRVCEEIQKYHQTAVQSLSELNALYRQENDDAQALEVVNDIQYMISGIFSILAEMLEDGQREKAVDPDVWPAAAARVLWVSIFALLDMTWLDKDGLFAAGRESGREINREIGRESGGEINREIGRESGGENGGGNDGGAGGGNDRGNGRGAVENNAEGFLRYGFRQVVNSLLVERVGVS
jgi:AcrR family transcriptional regulator